MEHSPPPEILCVQNEAILPVNGLNQNKKKPHICPYLFIFLVHLHLGDII